MREIDARDAFVVGGEGDGYSIFEKDGERVFDAANAEDEIVAGEIDFDEDVAGGHLLEELVGMVLVHDVHSMADALGVAFVNGGTDMEGESVRGNEAGSELASMQADVDFRINGVEVVQHLHLQAVIAHGSVAIFRHDEVDADEGGVG